MSEFNWDIEAKKKRDEERSLEKAKAAVAKIFSDWKSRLLSRRRRKVKDLKAQVESLTEQVEAALVKHKLKDTPWGDYTLELCKKKETDVSDLITAKEVLDQVDTNVNRITRYVDTESAPGGVATPEVFEFRNEDGLKQIPWVKKRVEEDGFVGIVRDKALLYAAYATGEMVLLGAVTSQVGIRNLPTVDEMRQNLSN